MTDEAVDACPKIILVSLDAVRADHLSFFGYGRPTTPFFARLAREGTRYEFAYSPTRWTLRANASMFTGTYLSRHGVSVDGTRLKRLSDPAPPLQRNTFGSMDRDGLSDELVRKLRGLGYLEA